MSVRIVELSRGFELNRWLCPEHIEKRKAAGWEVKSSKEPPHPLTCDDCDDRKDRGPSTLEARIAEDDAAKKAAEPAPAPVLPGQRRLF